MTEEVLTVKEKVLKLRNSNARYLKIPENQFEPIKHNDLAEVRKKEESDKIYLIYVFKKQKQKGVNNG